MAELNSTKFSGSCIVVVDAGKAGNLSERTALLCVCLLLVTAVFVIYRPTIHYDFVNFDDYQYIVDNPHLRNGINWKSVEWAFTTTYFSNWHPLTWLSYILDYQLYGLNSAGWHAENSLLHAINSVLLFVALRLMTRELYPGHGLKDNSLWFSATAALFFAVHPLRVESVAWASERKDLLCSLFGFSAVLAYCRYVKSAAIQYYILVAVFMALGLLCKAMLVTLPCIFLLLDYWPFGRWNAYDIKKTGAKLLCEKIPLLLLAAGSIAVSFAAVARDDISLEKLPLSARLANALLAYVAYIGKILWPSGLSFYYPYTSIEFSPWQVAGAAGVLLVVSAFAVWKIRRLPWLFVGWSWFLGTLLPVIGLVQVGSCRMADRYTYISAIGITIILIWGSSPLFKRRMAVWAWVWGAAIAGFIGCSMSQVRHWRDSTALFTHGIAVNSDNYMAHYGMGRELMGQGKYLEAIPYFEKTIAILPHYTFAYNELGVAYTKLGRDEEALFNYKMAVNCQPDYVIAYNNVGAVYQKMGHIPDATLAYEQAVLAYEAGEMLSSETPAYLTALLNLGACYVELGRDRDSLGVFQKLVRIQPDHATAHLNLGINHILLNDMDSAQKEYETLLFLDPAKSDRLLKAIREAHNIGE